MLTVRRFARTTGRALRRRPAWSLATAGVAALCTAVSATMYALIDARVLRPLPFPAPEEIVRLGGVGAPHAADIVEWFRSAPGIRHLATYAAGGAELETSAGLERVIAASVSGDFFTVLGLQPLAGRWLTAADEGFAVAGRDGSQDTGAPAFRSSVAVISERFWTARYGRAADVVGRRLRMDGGVYQVVGVAPAGLAFPEGVEVWVPRVGRGYGIRFNLADVAARRADFGLLGRLAAGASREQAEAEVRDLQAGRIRLDRARVPRLAMGLPPTVRRLGDFLTGDSRTGLWLLGAAVGFVVLVGAANVTSLSVSMTIARSADLAVRAACGASARALTGVTLTPVAALVAVGAAAGVLMAWWGVEILDRAIAWGPRMRPMGISGPVVAAAGLTAALMGAAAAGVALWLLQRQSLYRVLATGQPTTSGRVLPLATMMVALQVAASVVLLAGAGAALTGLRTLLAPPTGVEMAGATVADLIYARETGEDQVLASLDAIQMEVRALPSVRHVGVVDPLPFAPGDGISLYVYAGSVEETVPFRTVAGESFSALGVAIRAGQDFVSSGARRGTVIVSESLARAGWGGVAEALGQQLRIETPEERPREVIGVAEDVGHPTGSPYRRRGWQLYVPAADPLRSLVGTRWMLVARGDGGAAPDGSLIADRVRSVSPDARVHRVRAYDDVLWQRAERERVQAALFGVLSLLVLVLTGLGGYGLSLYATSLRQREIGVRLMVGAHPHHVIRVVVRAQLRAALIGGCLGLGATWVAARVVAASSVAFADPDAGSLAVSFLVVVGTAVVAGAAAARGFTRRSPSALLRYE